MSDSGSNDVEVKSIPKESEPFVEVYGAPSPPKSFFFAGAGWGYGLGCGVGPFFGVGVALGPSPLFGAGVGAGLYCGCGFGAGALVGNGAGYFPIGTTTSFFYTPRLIWAERIVEKSRRLRHMRRKREAGSAGALDDGKANRGPMDMARQLLRSGLAIIRRRLQ